MKRRVWTWIAPSLAILFAVALFPLLWTIWESLHRNDLRMPWLGRTFIGVGNYVELSGDGRFLAGLARTFAFAIASVALELVLGLAAALVLHRAFFARGALRTVALLPWALPTVVAGLLWRFLFDSEAGAIAIVLAKAGGPRIVWLAGETLAWIPIVLADVWKTMPFVALLLLAGLQQVPAELHEAAAIDGAGRWRRFVSVTLPFLRPAIVVAAVFRFLDALRVFDLIYVLTGGGPGTATEPVSLYAYNLYFQNLRFGYGSAAAMTLFVAALVIGGSAVALLMREET